MIEVLLSAPGIPSGCLQVAVDYRADPDLRPSRRNGQRPDPVDDLPVANRRAIDIEVNKTGSNPFAGEA